MIATEPDLFERGYMAGIAAALEACADLGSVSEVRARLLDLVLAAREQEGAAAMLNAGRARSVPAYRAPRR